MASDYELWRQKNVEENRKVLAEILQLTLDGENEGEKPAKIPRLENLKILKKPKIQKIGKPKKPKIKTAVDVLKSKDDVSVAKIRRSLRLRKESPSGSKDIEEEDAEEETEYETRKKNKAMLKLRENVFGPIEGVKVGDHYANRMEACYAGVHRPTVAGIHGSEIKGCYSLSLSGGYEDDVDMGECFTYTGAGGRDLKGTKAKPKNLRTGPQVCDQTLTGVNKALSLNVTNKMPVRVIRGYDPRNPYAPTIEGYRYDGLYSVEKCWLARGRSGYKVYKYALKRCDPAPPPWLEESEDIEEAQLDSMEEQYNSIEDQSDGMEESSNGMDKKLSDSMEEKSNGMDKKQLIGIDKKESDGMEESSDDMDEKLSNRELSDSRKVLSDNVKALCDSLDELSNNMKELSDSLNKSFGPEESSDGGSLRLEEQSSDEEEEQFGGAEE